MEQTSTRPPPSTSQPPEQKQPPPSSLTPPQPTATSTSAVNPITSAALPPTTTSSFPTTRTTTSAPTAPTPAVASSSSFPTSRTSSPQPTQPTSQSTTSQTTPPFNRPWQQPQASPFSHYSLPPPPLPLPPQSSSTTATNSSLPVPPPPRGGMAIGVPAHHPATPLTPATSFSSLNLPSFGQPFSGLGRNVPDSGPASSSSQVRQPIGGMQGMGMTRSLGSSSALRPPGIPAHQLRPIQSSLKQQPSPSTHSPAAQNFQGHGILRVPSVGSQVSPSPNSTQSAQSQNQPWLSSGLQGKPPLAPTSLRPQLSSQSMQQRSHKTQQHHHSMSPTSQQHQASSIQQFQQPPTSTPPQEQYGQQFPQSRIQQSFPNQQIVRGQGVGIQRPSHAMMPSAAAQTGVPSRTRSIQELVAQIDPSEKLDPEVEDILVDIAEDFVESITTFGFSLAKHRKSTTLEAKDILLHLERNWSMTLPGFSGDEIKTYKKLLTSDIHKEGHAVKSILAAEVTNSKSWTNRWKC